MINQTEARTLQGKTLHGADGSKLGTIHTLYADRDNGEPTFATVHTGLFGTKTHFVPLANATLDGDTVTVPYDKDLLSNAPHLDEDTELSPQEEQRLYSHYGTSDQGTASGAGMGENVHGTVGHDTSGPTTDDAMTRSEERLHVGTEKVETGRARLRKYLVTDTETVTVPVTREEVRIEREPITDGNVGKALDGPNLSEEEHEVVLTEERPVVAKETVLVERVRLGTETVTEQATVTEDVRKEQIDTDGITEPGTPGHPRR